MSTTPPTTLSRRWSLSTRVATTSTRKPSVRAKCSTPSPTTPPTPGVILGGRPIKPDELDLRWISALLYRNGVIEETGVAAGVLNHPANGVAWLANKLAPYDVQLEAGQIILGGSFTRPVPARKGDTFHVDYGNMGAISCRFV